ncbi:hydroxyacid dehydrogenase [Martelella mediterranea]|uniref:hydroxyacid dehydrogenase n=1 Tax=Martelella mediterranea TaxID=293089 RepID=UPI001E41F42F|nr:hydroxyacid dehydrogenase [Martelella mediterranea]MCD1636462.1 hydroxyacid dehydrogenase [Martelella mediterranea]
MAVKPMRIPLYVTEPIHSEAEHLLRSKTDVAFGTEELTREAVLERVAGAQVILSKTDPVLIDAQLMTAAPALRHVARHGTGYSNVDLDHATRNGIAVSIAAGVNTGAISEYTIGLMFAAARCLPQASAACLNGTPDRQAFAGLEVTGKTFGIVGVGRIGRAVVERVTALGMRVLAHHPRPSSRGLSDLPLELVGLERLLAESDVISLHTPLTAETRNLIGADQFARMKSTAILLNLSRGGVVDEAALHDALAEKRIFAAATDVLANEPVRSSEPLLQMNNCIVLPHIAAMTFDTQRNIAMTAARQCLATLSGGIPDNVVNPDALEHPKWKDVH